MDYKRKKYKKLPAISTASLPDIVFMLLFFFMTVTTIKDSPLLVDNELPMADQINKLDKKDRVIDIYVGKPAQELATVFGAEPKIQLDDRLAKVSDVAPYVLSQLAQKPEELRNLITVSLKVDKAVKMGIVSDIKEELRSINVLKVNYTTYEGDAVNEVY